MNQIGTNSHGTQLTQSQLMMWTGQKMMPDSPLYNMVLTFEIQGTIDVPCFQLAFQKLVDQSDALRTVFSENDGIPMQHVLPTFEYTIPYFDWTSINAPADKKAWMDKRIQRKFDLTQPSFDAVLIKLDENKWSWYLNQHHLITDAWAVSVLHKQMALLYGHFSKGHSEVESLPLFADYISYEKALRQDDINEKALEYWENVAAKLPPAPKLYGYNDASLSAGAKRISLDLGKERSEKLRELANSKELRGWTQHLSLFNIFATLLYTYVFRISEQTKIAIGTPTHNRTTTDFKNTPGVFIEVLPLMVEISPSDSFLAVFDKVRIASSEFLMNAKPGTINPVLGQGFNVVLNYIHATFDDFNGFPTKSSWLHPDHVDPRHHLRLQVLDFEDGGNIQLHFDLNGDVFDKDLEKVAPEHFMTLLDEFVADFNQSVSQALLPTPEEVKGISDILIGSKNEHQQSYASVIDLFENYAKASPENELIRFQGNSLSVAEVNKSANQIAHYLLDHDIEKGERIALYLPRTPELLISIIGVLKAGCTFVTVATDNPSQRIDHILEASNPALIITNETLVAKVSAPESKIWSVNDGWEGLGEFSIENPKKHIKADNIAYMMYTSGSTGKPKGVMISHGALANYLNYASQKYINSVSPIFPLFTSIGFDLTITSMFVPLISAGKMIIYQEPAHGPDLSLLKVIEENQVNIIKLTPAHLALISGQDLSNSAVETLIVGGEELKTNLARTIAGKFKRGIKIYNEYGPTEATVGCIVHNFDVYNDVSAAVPIGRPIPNMEAYILDSNLNPLPLGVPGELFLAGNGLADGYWKDEQLTAEKFVKPDYFSNKLMYRTGDKVRINQNGSIEFLGRIDHQVKVGGIRVEPGEIETALQSHPDIDECVVELWTHPGGVNEQEITNCVNCGLPSNYPNISFDDEGVCDLCLSFESYQEKAKHYFKSQQALNDLITIEDETERQYDCMMLLSGGKDSSYALAKLVEGGAKVLAYTLDNGYISEEAKANIRRVVEHLGVDHIFGETPAMNAIFVDSLKTYSNVCNGCFKTLYTLSTKIAYEKNIPYIVTGLSRGQFFETRLTEELFWKNEVDIDGIDDIILNARKAYHRVEDAVTKLLDTSIFKTDLVFEKVKFIDFYRFVDVSMDDMMAYLEKELPWSRPTDTGRSTNCLINQVGIYVHKKERGYSNYAFPYSWDVRLGHKTREGALDEINEEIDENEVKRIMDEIGYEQTATNHQDEKHLVAFYTGSSKVSHAEIREYLSSKLPEYMIPSYFKELDQLPLTSNGKVDRKALPDLNTEQPNAETPYRPPSNEFEEMLEKIWTDVLQLNQIGVDDNFLEIGGNSLAAIRIISRIEEGFRLTLPVNIIFELPTISALAAHIENTILKLMQAQSN